MVPGFVTLGAIAILAQILVIAAVYRYLQRRRQVAQSLARRRVRRLVFSGTFLIGIGQSLAIGAVGSLRVAAVLTLREAFLAQDIGLVLAFLGYLLVIVGFVAHARSAD